MVKFVSFCLESLNTGLLSHFWAITDWYFCALLLQVVPVLWGLSMAVTS